MLVGSPAPGVAADWHRALNVAAAKLAVAAGIAPAEVRRVSGLRRVEVKRTSSQILRQVTALAHAGVLTAEQIPTDLINGAETAEKILGHSANELGSQYLAICERARRYERMHVYFDHTEEFAREHTAIQDEFFRCKKKIRELDEEYDLVGGRLKAIANKVTHSTSWPTRRKQQEQVDELVRRRDSIRVLFAATCKQTGAVMDQYRRHQAKRVYYHSRWVPEYREEALVFIPASTLRKMLVCPFEEVRAGPAFRDKSLRLMREWNGYCEQFAIEKRSILEQHKQDEIRDHTLRALIARPAGQSPILPRPSSMSTTNESANEA
ncbi:hypothetical protein [Mycolicibacterium tusciae]|uniref:hypothetical protein n=1 Tax=Mycolicibacterium tusciae TaxID=75922 RepID=UPI00024A5096|nr:hypothetical protein [Mycolicibacterium tusciae]